MTLYTNNLILRTLETSDVEETARMWNFEKGAISTNDAMKAIEFMQGNHSKNKPGHIYHLCFAVFEKGGDKIIGWCGLDGKNAGKLHIFYLIDKDYRRKGYAAQCAEKLLSYAQRLARMVQHFRHFVFRFRQYAESIFLIHAAYHPCMFITSPWLVRLRPVRSTSGYTVAL